MNTRIVRRSTVALAAVALASLVAGCSAGGGGSTSSGGSGTSGEPVTGGNLTISSLPTNLDPYENTQRANYMIAASVCEGLFANAANTTVNPGLVEDYTYDEAAMTYTFTLRSGVTFHSGGTMTSADVVASLQRYAAGEAGAQFGALVADISAPDDATVVVTLNQPSGVIPALLATPDTGAYIQSADFLAKTTGDFSTLDCTGPYKLDSFTPDSEAVASRFDGYASRTEPSDGAAGAKVAYADTLTFVPNNDANLQNQLVTGQVDIATSFNGLDELRIYEADPAVKTVMSEAAGFQLLQFNLRQGAFTDVTMRQAVLNAIDPEALETQALGDVSLWQDTSSMFPEGTPWFSEEGSDVYDGRDPSKVAGLLDEAGYDGTPIRILYRADYTYGPLLKQQLEDAGFTVDLQTLDSAEFTATRTDETKWDMFLAGGSAYSDPATVVFLNDDFPGWWETDTKKAAMKEALAGADETSRKAAWDTVQGLIWSELPFIKMGFEPRLNVIGATIGGYEPSAGTVRGFYNVWKGE